jgi:hypothetical protein
MNESLSADLMWIAQRHGQDWRDEDGLAAIDWLISLVPAREWEPREVAVAARFQAAKNEWAQGRRVPLFDPKDQIAWYVLQTRFYADPAVRHDFFEPDGYRIAPVFRRLGQLLPDLRRIGGADERAARLMTHGRKQPDDGIYELLVAGAYKRRGWEHVEFVPERPGVAKEPDFLVDRRRTHRAVECKRAGRSGYAQEERSAGERMAAQVHEVSRTLGRSTIVVARFAAELTALPEDYLATKVARFADGRGRYEWDDDGGQGIVGDVFWGPLRRVLRHDDIYFGSSRMVQLLLGGDPSPLDTSVAGEWLPADGRPFHAHSVSRISLVGWISLSKEAARRKASHFRGVVGRASDQLPGDCPGVVHVGYEALGGNSVDGLRHRLNREQMRTFDVRESRLQWVYGNYWMPEHVTARNESAAVTETTAWYPVARPTTPEPLPGHMLFMDEDGRTGAHFVR